MKIGFLKNQADVDRFLRDNAPGRRAISDGRVRGLQLERMESGQARWRLRYQQASGRSRACLTLGDAYSISLQDARTLAQKSLGEVALGDDPKERKSLAKEVPRFAEFIDGQYLPYIRTYKRSWETDVSLLKNHLLPRFGNCFLDKIDRTDIQKMHLDRLNSGATPGSANRLLILMRYIFNLAIRWEVPGITVNPSKNIPLMSEGNKKERYLSEEEAKRLYECVCASENKMLRLIVPMLILTGARKREVLDARWEDFDFERRTWRIPNTKLGKPRHVPLSDGALSVLRDASTTNKCPWVFPNPDTGKPFVSIFCAWNTARKKAGLEDVRIHDLRHSFASLLINSGRSLYEVQKLLGHTQIKTTQRYAHLAPETLLEASNAATKAVGSVMGVLPNRVADVPLVIAYG